MGEVGLGVTFIPILIPNKMELVNRDGLADLVWQVRIGKFGLVGLLGSVW